MFADPSSAAVLASAVRPTRGSRERSSKAVELHFDLHPYNACCVIAAEISQLSSLLQYSAMGLAYERERLKRLACEMSTLYCSAPSSRALSRGVKIGTLSTNLRGADFRE